MDNFELDRAKQVLLDAQKKFIDTEHTLNTAHDAFLTSCQELTIAEKAVDALKLMDSHPPLTVHAEGA